MKIIRKTISVILAISLCTALCATAFAADSAALNSAADSAAEYVLGAVGNPEIGSVGGEWAVIGLARSGYAVPDAWFESYYAAAERHVRDVHGVLTERNYTEYSRVILGLTAAGYDPRAIGGYDLTLPLGDYDATVRQGINGAIFALLALDSGDYSIPVNKGAKTQATRERYVAEIVRRACDGGGWAYSGNKADPDVTSMALQALAKYQDVAEVKAATDRAVAFLSEAQDDRGGFSSMGAANSESAAQAIIALCALGIFVDDARFIKNGRTLVDNLLSFQIADGSFVHSKDGDGDDQMATETALCALVAVQRARDGRNGLYGMSDATKRGGTVSPPTVGLPGKHADVRQIPVTKPGTTFEDVAKHQSKAAIEALAAREIISGRGDGKFDPDGNVTRAEFAKMVAFGIGLPESKSGEFADVPATAWYAAAVDTANRYGIVNGVGGGKFNPTGTITRQEAAVMLARAAKLAGMRTERTDTEIRNTLAQFGDYKTVADWADDAFAFCYSEGILDDSALDIMPLTSATRAEIAEMLYRLLDKSNLL